MDRPKLWRVFLVTWTTGCAVVCLLLIALWVRTAQWEDVIYLSDGLLIGSREGGIGGGVSDTSLGDKWPTWQWVTGPVTSENHLGLWKVHYRKYPWGREIFVPIWTMILSSIAFAAAPWIPWRFSLRTLLVVITLFAAAIGVAVYFSRRPPESPPVDHGDFGTPFEVTR